MQPRKANPHLVSEPTYLNSLYSYISPWQIKHSDTVWGNAGGDCPAGMWPSPDYRESDTNSREYYIFRSLDEVWLPQNALQYFDIVQCDDGVGFPNHAAMAFGRGRFFVATYINPKFMQNDDWDLYAGLLKWARKNADILRNTTVLPSRLELGEPYAYAHWLGTRGIVAVRNPSNENQEYLLDLRKAGASETLRDGVAYTQYPYRKGVAAGLNGGSVIRLKLAPWELLFIEVQPRAELKEPIVLGARWSRDAQGRLSVAAERDTEKARLIDPVGGEREVALPSRVAGKSSCDVLLERATHAESGMEFELEYMIAAPADIARSRILLFIECPGRRRWESQCTAMLNGAPIALKQTTSQHHIGGLLARPNTAWANTAEYETTWTWYEAEIGPGTSRIRFAGSSQFARARLRVDRVDLSRTTVTLDVACPEPAMPQHQHNIERLGTNLGQSLSLGI